MSDFHGPDDANLSELTDDDKLASEYPPDEPVGAEEYGTTAREQVVPESLEERVAREEPDLRLGGEIEPDVHVGTLVDPEQGLGPDVTAEAVARELDPEGPGALDVDDAVSGDPTTRDVAQEREAGESAEEAAMHLTDPPPMGDGDGYVDEGS